MRWKFYLGDGPEAEELIRAAEKRRKTAYASRKALMEEYGADGLILSSGFTYGQPIALGYHEKQSRRYLRGETPCKDGYYYFPKLSTKAGKELAARLEDPDMLFDRSDHVIHTLGLFHIEHGEMVSPGKFRTYQSAAAYGGGVVLVRIPCRENGDREQVFQKIPAWLREVKESEFLAAQGK